MSEIPHYIKKLESTDWLYDYSDDHTVWRKGFTEYRLLKGMQESLDKNFTLWNKYAPKGFQKTLRNEANKP